MASQKVENPFDRLRLSGATYLFNVRAELVGFGGFLWLDVEFRGGRVAILTLKSGL